VRATKDRSHPEIVVEAVFGPLARVVTRLLLPLRVPPSAVVLANAGVGFVAAAAIVLDELVAAALLLQLKTVLDNADGQLARASGRTSALGRYLDTEADLLVNAALFAAIAYETGSPVLAVAGFCAVTLVLSVDFNAEVLYRRARGERVVTEPSARDEGSAARMLQRAYHVIYGPQDRILQSFSRRRLERVLAHVSDPDAVRRASRSYHDDFALGVLANLGLSTLLVVLGVCLVLNAPIVYPWLAVVAATVLLPALQARRELIARRAAGSPV
jgi:phosphatidylglycerophosphate synthase